MFSVSSMFFHNATPRMQYSIYIYTYHKDLHLHNLVSSIITLFVSILSSIPSITIYIDHPHIDREEFKSAIEDSSSFTTALSDEKREEVRRRTREAATNYD